MSAQENATLARRIYQLRGLRGLEDEERPACLAAQLPGRGCDHAADRCGLGEVEIQGGACLAPPWNNLLINECLWR